MFLVKKWVKVDVIDVIENAKKNYTLSSHFYN